MKQNKSAGWNLHHYDSLSIPFDLYRLPHEVVFFAETRGAVNCNLWQTVLGNVPGAAHCLRFNPLYYQVKPFIIRCPITEPDWNPHRQSSTWKMANLMSSVYYEQVLMS